MELIGKSKASKLNAKASIVYLPIRLPKTYADKIGKTANMCETQHGKQRALLMTFGEVTKTSCKVEPETEVIQPELLRDIKAYLLELESRIAELKALLLENENLKAS